MAERNRALHYATMLSTFVAMFTMPVGGCLSVLIVTALALATGPVGMALALIWAVLYGLSRGCSTSPRPARADRGGCLKMIIVIVVAYAILMAGLGMIRLFSAAWPSIKAAVHYGGITATAVGLLLAAHAVFTKFCSKTPRREEQ